MKTTTAILSLIAAGMSQGATLVQTQNYSFVPNGSQNLTFNKFNPAWGTLTSITVATSLTKNGGSIAGDNDSATTATVDFTSEVWGNISSTAVQLKDSGGAKIVGATIGDLDALDTTTITLGATSGDATNQFNVTGQSDYASFSGPLNTVTTSDSVGSSYWSGYSGTGTYIVKMNATNASSISQVSGVQYAVVAPSVYGSVTVTYNYIATVPEVDVSLLGLIPACVFLTRRRR